LKDLKNKWENKAKISECSWKIHFTDTKNMYSHYTVIDSTGSPLKTSACNLIKPSSDLA
jgi:hypothetical protein